MAEVARTRRAWAWVRCHPFLTTFLALVLALVLWAVLAPSRPDYEYIAEPATRGEVRQVVQASGKVRALNTFKVGSEVSGQVSDVFVDYNTPVRAGQPLAQIDPTRLRARVLQAEAGVRSAQATLAQAEAARARARTDLIVQRRDFSRREQLAGSGFVTRTNLDQGVAAVSAAQAAVETSAAGVQSARAGIAQAQAELASARLDLSRTRIIAPAGGVVINKLVEPGATVAASFQTPNLFEIAADTTLMQVEASVDEADIGKVAVGQPVDFTVDAYPDQVFRAVVRQIRKAPTEAQNVVSYLAILDVPNPEGKLLPGMTANVEIVTAKVAPVTRVPAAALRFRPRPEDRPPGQAPKGDHVWVATADALKPVRRAVQLGIRGEDFVEIKRGLKPGDRVLVRRRELNQPEPEEEEEDEEAGA